MGGTLHNLAGADELAKRVSEARARLDEAIQWQEKAMSIDPANATARQFMLNHLGLQGRLRTENGQLDAAVILYRKALKLTPKSREALLDLGYLLLEQKRDGDGALTCFQKWFELEPMNPGLHYMMGRAHAWRGDLDAAIASYRKVIELNPALPMGHGSLGWGLLNQGRYAEARAALNRTLELQPANDPQRKHTEGLLKDCTRLEKLERRLDRFLKNQDKPASAAESRDLALVCRHKQLHAAAVRFAALAYSMDPKLGNDLEEGNRHDATLSAALAAADKGKDTTKLDDIARSRLRKQALSWLRADLVLRIKQLKSDSTEDREAAQASLSHWQFDNDFATIRDKAALAKLPVEERAEFTKFWGEVAAVLAKLEQHGFAVFSVTEPKEADQLKTEKDKSLRSRGKLHQLNR